MRARGVTTTMHGNATLLLDHAQGSVCPDVRLLSLSSSSARNHQISCSSHLCVLYAQLIGTRISVKTGLYALRIAQKGATNRAACLRFIDHTHSTVLMRLRMLKLSVGKGRQVIGQKQLQPCSRVLRYIRYSGYRARGVRALIIKYCLCMHFN